MAQPDVADAAGDEPATGLRAPLRRTTPASIRRRKRIRRRDRRSILDIVAERTSSLVVTLGPADRRKVDEYLTSVREIERRIEIAERDTTEVTPDFDMPSGVPVLFADYATLMFDMQALALQSDLTRVSTLMIGREGSLRTYPEIGVPDPHHPLTHHRDNPEWIEKVTKVNVFHMELFARFVGKLTAMPEGDGTVLDHTMIVYGSGIADGNKHTHENLPVLLVGGGAGVQGRPAPRLRRQHADDELLPDAAGSRGRAGRSDRRQHGTGGTPDGRVGRQVLVPYGAWSQGLASSPGAKRVGPGPAPWHLGTLAPHLALGTRPLAAPTYSGANPRRAPSPATGDSAPSPSSSRSTSPACSGAPRSAASIGPADTTGSSW